MTSYRETAMNPLVQSPCIQQVDVAAKSDLDARALLRPMAGEFGATPTEALR